MHIGILLGSNKIGGMERQASMLARALHEKGIEVTVFFAGRPRLFTFYHKVDFSPVKYRYLFSTRYSRKLSLRYFGFLVKKLHITILYAFHVDSMRFAHDARKYVGDIPITGSVRGIKFSIEKKIRFKLKEVCSKLPCVICNSPNTRRLLIEQKVCPENKISVIANGIQIDQLAKQKTKKDHDKLNILFAGSLKPVKDPLCFSRAASLVLTNIPNIYVTIAGTGVMMNEMQAFFREKQLMDHVKFIGQVDCDAVPYDSADLVVSSSIREASSNTILEALAHGLTVVATAVGGSIDILEGKPFGLLVQPRDENAMARAIEQFLGLTHDQRRDLGRKAIQYIQENYSLKAMVDQHLELFRQLSH